MKFLALAAAASTVAAQQRGDGQKGNYMRGAQQWGNGLLHTLNEGDLCKSGGVESGNKVDNSKHCPKAKGLQCLPQTGVMGIGGEVNYYCCKDAKNCGPTKTDHTKVKTDWCNESPAQRCRMLCPQPSCETEDQCAYRTDSCCSFKCYTPTPDANGEDDEGCEDINVSSQDEMKYKEEFDLLDTDNDDAVSTTETTAQVQKQWQQKYAKYCNDNDADKKKYGNWDQWGKDKDKTIKQWQQTWNDMQDKAKSGVQDALSGIIDKTSGLKDKLKGYIPSGSDNKGRKLQKQSGSFTDKIQKFFGGKAGFGKNKDEDCTQQLNAKAAKAAAQVFKQLDSDGDNKISFCEYVQTRVNMARIQDMITVNGRMLAEA